MVWNISLPQVAKDRHTQTGVFWMSFIPLPPLEPLNYSLRKIRKTKSQTCFLLHGDPVSVLRKLRPGGRPLSHSNTEEPLGENRSIECPALCPLPVLPWPQMILALGVLRLCSEVLALVLWVAPLVALLKELLRATGRSGNSWRCHWRHFF